MPSFLRTTAKLARLPHLGSNLARDVKVELLKQLTW